MATLLNRKIGYLTIVDKTIRTAQLDDQAVTNEKVADATLAFAKTNAGFAAALLDTVKRAVYPIIGGEKQTLPAASGMDVTALMGAVPASLATPTYDAGSRTWSNLGAVIYAPENKVLIRVPDPASMPDGTGPLRDAQGGEVYGRLVKSGETWTVELYHAPGGVETPYTNPVAVEVLMVYKHWVTGSSALLEDQGKTIVTAPGAVDIVEMNNIEQLAKELGIVLGNDGQMTLPKSLVERINDHVTGAAERHNSNDLDAHLDVNINGFAEGGSLTQALNQLQANITATGTQALNDLRLYFNELRSNGILGTDAVLANDAGLNVALAACVAYVAGRRFAISAQTLTVVDYATTKVWIDNVGAVQMGAAYPADVNVFTKVGTVTAEAGVVTLITDDHFGLVELDQKVYDIEALLEAHINSTTAHNAEDIVFDNATAGLLKADNTPVSNAQEAIEALQRRLSAIRRKEEVYVLTQEMIDTAVVDGALKFILLTLPAGESYEVGKLKMECIIDGDDQDLNRVFTEANSTSVRVYFDPAEPLVEQQRVKLRWLSV